MENLIRRTIMERKSYLEKLLLEVQQSLLDVPEGTLRISRDKGRIQYYHRLDPIDPNGVYLKQAKQELIKGLAQKEYAQKLCRAIQKELRALERCLKDMPAVSPENVYPRLPEFRQNLVVPVIEPDNLFLERWMSVSYQGKPFAEDFPEFLTDRGERVRSKSEVIIANLLLKEGIPYRYEYPLKLWGLGTVYPDFTVLNIRLRKEIYWEHQGMMDDPEYADQAVRKMKYYYRNGYYPGDRLILTSETKMYPINTQELKMFVDQFLR